MVFSKVKLLVLGIAALPFVSLAPALAETGESASPLPAEVLPGEVMVDETETVEPVESGIEEAPTGIIPEAVEEVEEVPVVVPTNPVPPAPPVTPAPVPPPLSPEYSLEGQWYCSGEYVLTEQGQRIPIFEENWMTVGEVDYSVTTRYTLNVGYSQEVITYIEGTYMLKTGSTFIPSIENYSPDWLEVSNNPILLDWQSESAFYVGNEGGGKSLCEKTYW